MTIFEILNSISFTKIDLSGEDGFDKEYNPFMINRFLSMSPDTAFYADLMNKNSAINKVCQYQMLLQLLPKKKRFFKYHKKEEPGKDLQAIAKYFNVNQGVALQYAEILDDTEKKSIQLLMKEM